ncbi:MAG: tRNA pseudouridine(55) synthase TruB [Anaerolineae bacterium]
MSMKEGVLIIDKPPGMTSHDVVNRVRRVSGIRRVGHAGTLDPLATGVLLLCLGRATRLVEYLVGHTKTYEATVRLGQTTDTYDADGKVVAERPSAGITTAAINEAMSKFRGRIRQRPPIYSAIKQQGQPLHKLARRGEEVEAPVRDVTIYELTLLAWSPPELHLRMVCSSGTYVRSLAHDLGEALGCGGHVTALRRTAVGPFTVGDALPLGKLTPDNLADHLQPMDVAVSHLPRLELTAAAAAQMQQGQRLAREANQPVGPLARAYDLDGRFMGVLESTEYGWRPRKVILPATEQDS